MSSEDTLDGLPAVPPAALSSRYELLDELGRGGMGIVYKARDRETGELVALKVLKPEIAADQAAMERFKNELRLARKITHKNVCRIHEFSRAGDTAYISMEFVEGDSLRAILKRFDSMSVRKTMQMAGQICAALREAHGQDIIHRDLKPENVMLDRAGQVKVMDFGIARSRESGATQTGAVIGTPAYMAPEQAAGKPVDNRSDIYAVGLILYEMLTGVAAFRGDAMAAVLLKQMQEAPASPRELEPSIPVHFEKAILKCLEKNPARRFASVDELEAALTRAPEEKPARVETPTEVAVPLRLATWQRSDWVLLAAAFASAFVFFLLFDRVFPFGAIQAPMSSAEAIRNARNLLAKYAPETSAFEHSPSFRAPFYIKDFQENVLARGIDKTILDIETQTTSWAIRCKVPDQALWRVYVAFDHRGKPQGINFPEEKGSHSGDPPGIQDVLPQAAQFVERVFEIKLKGATPLPYEYDKTRAQWSRWVFTDSKGQRRERGSSFTPVEWVLPTDSPDTKRFIEMAMYPGRPLSAWTYLKNDPLPYSAWSREDRMRLRERRWDIATALGGLGFIILCLFCLILFVTRRLFAQTFGEVWLLTGLILLADFVLTAPLRSKEPSLGVSWWIYAPLALVVGLLLNYGLLSVPYYYLSQTLPAHLKSFSDLLRQRLRAQLAGLAVIRGALLGFLCLAGYSVLLLLLGKLKLAAASLFSFDLAPVFDINTRSRSIVSLSFLVAAGATWLLTGLPLALIRRTTARTWVLLGSTALLWAATPIPFHGTSVYPTLFLYLFAAGVGTFFSFVFLRYDLLTCFFAVWTVQTWLMSYALFRVYAVMEPWSYVWGLVAWFLLLLAGAAMWFRPQLSAARRRLAAVFE